MQVENTGNQAVSVTYIYDTQRTDITANFYDGETPIEAPLAIDVENTEKIWLRLEGEPGEVLSGTVIGTVKLTIE